MPNKKKRPSDEEGRQAGRQATGGVQSHASAEDSQPQASGEAVSVWLYVDGFNLYHGMHERFGRKYLWLDLMALGAWLAKPDQSFLGVKYFTARMRGGGDSAARQGEYLGALRATGVDVVEGRFQEKHLECRRCHYRWRTHEEKESDVSLSVSLVEDAANAAFETALLLTGDSDMCPAVRAAMRLNPTCRVVAVFPPSRSSEELRRVVGRSIHLGATALRQCQLPTTVNSGSRQYKRPGHWA